MLHHLNLPLSRTLAVAMSLLAATATPALAQAVGQLWETNCIRCHGPRGEGGPLGTSSLLNKDYLTDGSDRALFQSIREGHEEHGMPPFRGILSDAEMWALVVHIRELQDRAERHPRHRLQQPVETQQHRYVATPVISEGLRIPWSMAFLPDGAMLITNRPGELMLFRDGTLTTIEGSPRVLHSGQGGLLEVRPHPEHADNGWIYLAYTDGVGDGRRSISMTRLVRGRINNNRWEDEQTIFEARERDYLPGGLHFGCKIAFDPGDPGTLFFTIGERGRGEHAQDLARPNGKVHRVRDDGAIPDDNPFAGRDDAYPSIWSYGHRNPQGLTFDLNGNLWNTEHGPRGGDELNLIQEGKNYGWPLVSFGINYNGLPLVTPWPDVQGIEREITMPVDTWTPSIAASGLTVVTADQFPQWHGDLLAGGLASERIDRVRLENGRVTERELVLQGLGRIRDIVNGPDGAIYLVVNNPDQVLRLESVKRE